MRFPILTATALAAVPVVEGTPDCRSFPGDKTWPSSYDWTRFNSSVGGSLIRTVPLGTVCHDPQYDEAACKGVKEAWFDPMTHIQSSHSIMSPYFANQSCDPFIPRDRPCFIGTYVQYSVNASSAESVSEAVRFANEKNIRLVVRNTAHDYLGKSTGAGALAIWTQHLKKLSKVAWDDGQYTGPAIKMGAGIMGSEAIDFANQHGLLIVSGHCPSVGLAGGHIQGGGHSPLSSKYGLAADNALEFEVVDGTGKQLVANRKQNRDLFWALSGGGGGTYGVVTGVTVKAHPETSVTMGSLSFQSAGLDEDTYDEAIGIFHSLLPTLLDASSLPIWTFTEDIFMLTELMVPGLSGAEVDALMKPFLDFLDSHAVQFQKEYKFFPSYKDYNCIGLAQWLKNQANTIQGGAWFLPRSKTTDPKEVKELIQTVKRIGAEGAICLLIGFDVSAKGVPVPDNAVFPGWRKVQIMSMVGAPWNSTGTLEEGRAQLDSIDEKWISQLRALAPEGGTYLNEAHPGTKNWKDEFYGANYGRLLAIKNKYDPHHLFYARTAVGSDYWTEQNDKRLCKSARSATDNYERYRYQV